MTNHQEDTSILFLDKWQHLLTIVNKYGASNSANSSSQFKKLFISRLISENMLVFLLQYTGIMLSALTASPAPAWLASGTACAFIFLRGPRVLPGIWIGSLFAYYFLKVGLAIAILSATVLTLQSALILWICYRFISPSLVFYKINLFVKFIICSAVITAVSSLLLELILFNSAFFHLWLQWWLANFNGLLIFSCALMAWDAYFPQLELLKQLSLTKLVSMYVLLFFFVMLLVLSHQSLLIGGALFIITIIIAYYYGWCGAVSTAFLCALTLSLAAYLGAPVSFSKQLLLTIGTLMGLGVAIWAS